MNCMKLCLLLYHIVGWFRNFVMEKSEEARGGGEIFYQDFFVLQ